MDVSLVMVKADGGSREVKLDREQTVLGRDESCRLRIPLNSISRKHCEIRVEDDAVTVTDLGSSNGTYVNGKRVRSAELAPGDLVCVGPVVFVVRIDGHPRQIDAKDSFAAGAVIDDADDSGADLPTPAAARPGAGSPPARASSDAPTTGSRGDLSELLKDLDLGDDDDDEPPAKKK